MLLSVLLTAVSLLSAVSASTAAADADLIVSLPGLDYPTNFKQYSGYLDAGSDDVFHYWFIEASETDPDDSPLLLWLNGGPGCSSMSGLLTELGPFSVKEDGKTLQNNPHSWNTFANIVYLESPACVGYSYNKENKCRASDDSTAAANYEALKSFFAKFPSYRSNAFYVTGESYGGVYIPTLSVRIVENNATFPINFQGFAVGNGLSSHQLNGNSLIFFGNYHGLFGKTLWDSLVSECCVDGQESPATCDFHNPTKILCKVQVMRANAIIQLGGLNVYNLYADCLVPPAAPLRETLSRQAADKRNLFRAPFVGHPTTQLGLDPPCIDASLPTAYLNRGDVRAALHIPDSLPDWETCNDVVNRLYSWQYADLSAQYNTLHKAGIRGLVYNGDVDMACNFIGDQWFVENLGYPLKDARRMWHSAGQVAGFVKRFELLDLVTIRGSGHMVPQDKPQPALDMIKAFIQKTDY